MSTEKKLTKEEARRLKNAGLIRRMKAGDSLASIDLQASLFPNRPVIKKDKEIVKKLFKEDDTDVNG